MSAKPGAGPAASEPDPPADPGAAAPNAQAVVKSPARSRRVRLLTSLLWLAIFAMSWGGAIALLGWPLGGLVGWWPAATAASIVGIVALVADRRPRPG